MQSILEHGQRLLRMVSHQLGAFQVAPGKRLSGTAGNEKAVPPIDLGKMSRDVANALRQWVPTGGNSCLHHIHFTLAEHLVQIPVAWLCKIVGFQSLFCQKTCRYRSQQWSVKGGMPVNHDTDGVGHGLKLYRRRDFAR